MNDLFLEILKSNEFRILSRKLRNLKRYEASYLCFLERVDEKNKDIYVDTIMDGPCEIIVMSKIGAV